MAWVGASSWFVLSPPVILAQSPGPYAGTYGDARTIALENLLNGNIPLNGAVRTRGVLEAGPRIQGGFRRYSLALPMDSAAVTVQRRLSITPGTMIRDSFDFDADSLNMREIEVVGTFQAGVGTDAGTGTGFWFWAYSAAEGDEGGEKADTRRGTPTGLLAIEDLADLGDLPPAGAPVDGWVIKDGESAVWVSGKRPKGDGWSLDPESRSDCARWVEVEGKIEKRDGVTLLRAAKVTLVPPPKPDAPE
jgi:hypothetical protein